MRQVTVIVAGLLSQGLPHPFFPVTVSQNPCGLFLPVPPSEITPGLSLLLRNLLPPGRIRECCLPCGFLLSLFLFPKRAFYLLLDGSNILFPKQEKQFFKQGIINNL